MIQRKQSLFLLVSALLGLTLLFVPNQSLITATGREAVTLTPLQIPFVSTGLHYVVIALNFAMLALSFITIFLYKNRALQVKLCYTLLASWIVLSVLMSIGTFAVIQDPVVSVDKNHLALVIGFLGLIACVFAARFIKKDIELLKSADRIR